VTPAERAQEIVETWRESARVGWEAEHACQHGTTCCSPDQLGPDAVDIDGLVADVAAALAAQAAQHRKLVDDTAHVYEEVVALRVQAAQTRELEQERDELRQLIARGHSRGAAISPGIRRIFAAGSKAAAERDALTLRLEAEAAQTRALREALEEACAWGDNFPSCSNDWRGEEHEACIQQLEVYKAEVLRKAREWRAALTGAPREAP